MTIQRRTRAALRGLILTLLFGFATTISAQPVFWTGGGLDFNWDNGSNWSSSSVPGAGNAVTISTVGALSITLPTNRSTQSLTISGPVTLVAGSTTLTTGPLTVNSGSLTLKRTSSTTNTFLAITNLDLSAPLLRDATSTGTDVRITVSGTVDMSDVSFAYVGQNVRASLTSLLNSPPLITDARFDGELNLPNGLKLGDYNLYLGKAATLTGLDAFGSNGVKFIHTAGDDDDPRGTVRRQYDAAGQSFYFPVGPVDGRMSPLLLTIAPTQTNPSIFGPASPWPYISVRCLLNGGQGHPMNDQNSKIWVYWVVKGVGVNEPVLLNGEMSLHNNYRSGNPTIYSARWTPHYEDFLGAIGFWDITGSQPGNSGSSERIVPFSGFTGFGDYNIGKGVAGNDPIPVELTSFSARYVRNNVELNWQTATELNNYGFAIERSLDGRMWNEIDFVPGAGNSFSTRSYTYADLLDDATRRVPQLAYRLRQIDRDGTTDYSDIVFVKTGVMPAGVELYEAYPNPFNPSTTVSFSVREAMPVTMKVFNIFGQEVATLMDNAQTDAGFHTVAFNGDNMPSGSYLVVLNAGGVLKQKRLVLNK